MAAKNKKRKNNKTSRSSSKSLLKYLSDNLLFVSMYAFVFMAIMSYIVTPIDPPNSNSHEVAKEVLAAQDSFPKDYPYLKPEEGVSFPIISAQGALAIDLETGKHLYEKNPDELLLPASTVKILTALVSMQYYNLNDVIVIGNINVDGQKMGLVEGEEITVNDLLNGLLVYSANDAAEVLAQNYKGGRDIFVNDMNLKAVELGAGSTYISNPTGLDGNGQITTAEDLIKIAKVAMEDPYFASLVSKKQIDITSVDGQIHHSLESTNELIGKVKGVKGVKTGWTQNAKENLVTYVERNGREVMIAVLGSQDRFGETEILVEWVYENYIWDEV